MSDRVVRYKGDSWKIRHTVPAYTNKSTEYVLKRVGDGLVTVASTGECEVSEKVRDDE